MAIPLSENHVRMLRLRAQGLRGRQVDTQSSISQLVTELCGIQAQDMRAAMLAIRVRSSRLVITDVEHALERERSIVRTWGLRGTLHLLPADDLGWLLQLFGPVFIAKYRRRRAELGLDEATCVRGMQLIRDILTNRGPLTRDELIEQIAMDGLPLAGQARPHLLMRAALEGVVCFGPELNGEPGYVLLSNWLAFEQRRSSLSEMAMYTELTRRYLGAYGPATPQDQAAWSGLPIGPIRAAWQRLADQLLEVEIGGSLAWILKTREAWIDEAATIIPEVRLLPSFDTYLLGYWKRDLVVPSYYARRINAGGGMIHPVVLVNGRAEGTWKSKRLKHHLEVQVEPFAPLTPEMLTGIESEVEDLGRFLRTQASFQVVG